MERRPVLVRRGNARRRDTGTFIAPPLSRDDTDAQRRILPKVYKSRRNTEYTIAIFSTVLTIALIILVSFSRADCDFAKLHNRSLRLLLFVVLFFDVLTLGTLIYAFTKAAPLAQREIYKRFDNASRGTKAAYVSLFSTGFLIFGFLANIVTIIHAYMRIGLDCQNRTIIMVLIGLSVLVQLVHIPLSILRTVWPVFLNLFLLYSHKPIATRVETTAGESVEMQSPADNETPPTSFVMPPTLDGVRRQ